MIISISKIWTSLGNNPTGVAWLPDVCCDLGNVCIVSL